MTTGKALLAAGTGVLTAVVAGVCGVLACCAGAWVFLGPVNYFGCGTERPDGITETDLAGTYRTDDGAELELRADGGLTATRLFIDWGDERRDVSGPGTWRLQPETSSGEDIDLSLGRYATHLDISGSRKEPWLFWFDGDPDGCHLYHFDRVA